jgi:hypothetical protein
MFLSLLLILKQRIFKIFSSWYVSFYSFSSMIFESPRFQDANPTASARTVNVLIKSLSKCQFRVLPAIGSTSIPLTIGLPQIDFLDSSSSPTSVHTNNYTFQLHNLAKVSLHITPFIESDPNLLLIGPAIHGESQIWSSSKLGSDSILFIPSSEELGGVFTLQVTSTNASYYTLVLIDETQPLLPSSPSPTHLLSGFEIQQSTETGSEYHYSLHVPADLNTDIVVIVTPLYGDVDLFVNPQQDGFYLTNFTSPESNPAKWSSELSFGPDSIVINHQDPGYLITGGEYYITVRAVSNCQFVLRGYSADTIITLTEGRGQDEPF